MMLANVPVVFLGNAAAGKLPLGLIRVVTAMLFLALGLYAGWMAWTHMTAAG
jgi:putative Ca2+/H+ antiporter (TMEM165/GDT1 family)